MNDTETNQQIPTDHDELVAWLRGSGPRGWQEAEKLLTAELGDADRALKALDAVEQEIIHDDAIDSHRNDLRRALDDAVSGVTAALGALDALVSPSIYDVEYAEGAAAGDVRAFLLDARRALRAADALNPVKDT